MRKTSLGKRNLSPLLVVVMYKGQSKNFKIAQVGRLKIFLLDTIFG